MINISMYNEQGVIVEVGTGSYAGSYKVQYDSGGSPLWVSTYGQKGVLFVLGANDEKLYDVNAAPKQPAGSNPPAHQQRLGGRQSPRRSGG